MEPPKGLVPKYYKPTRTYYERRKGRVWPHRTFHERKLDRSAKFWAYSYGWKQRPCTACNGSGRYDVNGSPKCGGCEGTGREAYKGRKHDALWQAFRAAHPSNERVHAMLNELRRWREIERSTLNADEHEHEGVSGATDLDGQSRTAKGDGLAPDGHC